MVDFSQILSKPADAVEKPKPLPTGHYTCLVMGVPEVKALGQNETPAAIVQLRPLAPDSDVNQEALIAQGGIKENTRLRVTLFLSDDAQWRFIDFCKNCGIDPAGKTLKELLDQLPNRQIKAQVGHRPSQDGTEVYSDVKSTLPV